MTILALVVQVVVEVDMMMMGICGEGHGEGELCEDDRKEQRDLE